MSAPARHIAAQYVLAPEGLVRHGVVSVASDGTILSVGRHEEMDSAASTEFHNGILTAGLVNAHAHLELSYMKGVIAPGCGFTGFAAALGTLRDRYTRSQQLDAALYAHSRMQAEGTVAVGDISNGDLTFDIKARGGIFYHTFLELYGLGRTSAASVEPLLADTRRRDIAAGITPHSTYSLNEAAFRAAVEADREGVLSVHFMESAAERELYDGRGEFVIWYSKKGFRTDFTEKYASPAERIVKNIPGRRRILLVHNTFVTQKDATMLADHFGDNLTWVLCPRSNAYITGAVPPVEMLRRTGARIAVGTDSLASNVSLSIVDELKAFGNVPLAELLKWATAGGAGALGIDRRFGSLEPGKRPGLTLITGVDFDRMALTPSAESKNMLL